MAGRAPLAESLLCTGRYVEAWETATDVVSTSDRATAARAHRLPGTALLRTGSAGRATSSHWRWPRLTIRKSRRIQSLHDEAHAM